MSLSPARKAWPAASETAWREPGRKGGDGLVEVARRGGLDQLARPVAGGGRRPRRELGDLVGAPPDEDRAPHGDADGDPDLAERVVDPGRHAALLGGHEAHGHVGDDRG
jgi:hypothetical protein